MKSYKENGLFVFFTGLIIAIGRLLFSNESAEEILIFMAIINYIALGLVLLFLHIKILNKCNTKLTDSGFVTKQKKRRNFYFNFFSIILLLIYLYMGIIYIKYIKTTASNDAISIVALSISIASNNLEILSTKIYYQLIMLLVSFIEKIEQKYDNYKQKKREKREKKD